MADEKQNGSVIVENDDSLVGTFSDANSEELNFDDDETTRTADDEKSIPNADDSVSSDELEIAIDTTESKDDTFDKKNVSIGKGDGSDARTSEESSLNISEEGNSTEIDFNGNCSEPPTNE